MWPSAEGCRRRLCSGIAEIPEATAQRNLQRNGAHQHRTGWCRRSDPAAGVRKRRDRYASLTAPRKAAIECIEDEAFR